MTASSLPRSLVFVTGFTTGVLTLAGLEALGGQDSDLELLRVIRDRALAVHVSEHEPRELVDDALRGMLSGLDSYSRYYPPARAEALDRETKGEYLGVGILFFDLEQAVVSFALPGSPADKAGLRPGDRLIRIDDELVADLSAEQLRESLRRAEADPIEMDVEGRNGNRRTLRMAPAYVTDPSIRHEQMRGDRVGYLALLSFTRQTAMEFDRAVGWLRDQGAEALIIDLRGNPGGTLDAALRLADRFVSQGVLVSTRSRFETRSTHAQDSETRFAGLPTVVLVDADTASASEVLCGALQDYRAAVVVGVPTYGKGAVQTLYDDFEDPGVRVKITTSHYFTPAGRRIERNAVSGGIAPDVHVEQSPQERRAIQAYLQTYSPPPDALAEIAAWEQEESAVVLAQAPDFDRQLAVAVDLLEGRAPGQGPGPGMVDGR